MPPKRKGAPVGHGKGRPKRVAKRPRRLVDDDLAAHDAAVDRINDTDVAVVNNAVVVPPRADTPELAQGVAPLDPLLIQTIVARVLTEINTANAMVPPKNIPAPAEDPSDTFSTADVVSKALQNLISGESGELADESPMPCTSISYPLGATLSATIRSKIWSSEYINLASLLDINHDEDISVTLKKSGGKPTISLSNSSRREINSIEQWTKAFLVYAAVYSEKHGQEAPGLFKYISVIREMARQKKQWVFYDKQFRRLRANTPTMAWSEVNWEMYFTSITSDVSGNVSPSQQVNKPFPAPRQGSHQRQSGNHPFVPMGYCYEYHFDGVCDKQPCQYKHWCPTCHRGTHSAIRCNFNSNTKTNSSNARPSVGSYKPPIRSIKPSATISKAPK